MITLDPYITVVFPKPPLIAYKRQRHIGDIIIKFQVPTEQQQRQNLNGIEMCLICPICPFIKEAKGIKQDITTWKLKRQKTVQSENIAYMII